MEANNTEPWLTGNSGPHSKFYSSWYGKKNANTIYSPGIDRFILTDNYSLWIMMEVGRLLSSKIPTQVFLLGKDVTEFDNTNCLEHTIVDKRKYVINGSNILTARQVPSLHSVLGEDSVRRVGIPKDYQSGTHKQMLSNLRSYALFTLRCVHAIYLADSIRNIAPFKEMLDAYMPDSIPENFHVYQDLTSAPNGIKNQIRSILYESLSIQEALESIEILWYAYPYLPEFRNSFYGFLGLPVPERLKAQLYDTNHFTPKAV